MAQIVALSIFLLFASTSVADSFSCSPKESRTYFAPMGASINDAIAGTVSLSQIAIKEIDYSEEATERYDVSANSDTSFKDYLWTNSASGGNYITSRTASGGYLTVGTHDNLFSIRKLLYVQNYSPIYGSSTSMQASFRIETSAYRTLISHSGNVTAILVSNSHRILQQTFRRYDIISGNFDYERKVAKYNAKGRAVVISTYYTCQFE